MNNLSSNCGLVDAKIRASDKDLPVFGSYGHIWVSHRLKKNISQEHKKQGDDFRLDFLEAKLQRKLHGLRFCTVFFHADLIYRMSDL